MRVRPQSQWAAVRKTVGEISVPLHVAQVPSEYACGASSAPTLGWRLPSTCPLTTAEAVPPNANTSATAVIARIVLRIYPSLGLRVLEATALLGTAPQPFLAALVDLLLPERHGLLEPVDRLAAGGQRVLPVRCRDGDHHARLADLDPADAVVDRDRAEVVFLLELGRELRDHVLGHLGVCLVVEVEHFAPA